jgi:hypothetical protein
MNGARLTHAVARPSSCVIVCEDESDVSRGDAERAENPLPIQTSAHSASPGDHSILENAVETTDFAVFTDIEFSRTVSAFTSQVRFEPEARCGERILNP